MRILSWKVLALLQVQLGVFTHNHCEVVVAVICTALCLQQMPKKIFLQAKANRACD